MSLTSGPLDDLSGDHRCDAPACPDRATYYVTDHRDRVHHTCTRHHLSYLHELNRLWWRTVTFRNPIHPKESP